MSNLWFTSDTHFNHRRIAEYGERPENHEDLMWEGLQCVGPNDTLVHVGDVVFARNQEAHRTLERLPGGKKILLEGNHDKRNRKIRKWEGWNGVYRYRHIWQFQGWLSMVAVTHRPVEFEGRHHFTDICIHGHIHQRGKLFRWIEGKYPSPWGCLQVNVCVEQTGYSPISFAKIYEKWKEERTNFNEREKKDA